MFKNTTLNYTRINKSKARKLYNLGRTITVLPCKANPTALGSRTQQFQKNQQTKTSTPWSTSSFITIVTPVSSVVIQRSTLSPSTNK